ncbi:MAG: hypothetical protein ABI382_06850, partial [Nakamurella sp.]
DMYDVFLASLVQICAVWVARYLLRPHLVDHSNDCLREPGQRRDEGDPSTNSSPASPPRI